MEEKLVKYKLELIRQQLRRAKQNAEVLAEVCEEKGLNKEAIKARLLANSIDKIITGK